MFVPLRDRFGKCGVFILVSVVCVGGITKTFATIFVLAGTTQLLVPATATAIGASGTETVASAREILAQLPVESVIYAEGTVRERPDGMHNPDMPTGSCTFDWMLAHMIIAAFICLSVQLMRLCGVFIHR